MYCTETARAPRSQIPITKWVSLSRYARLIDFFRRPAPARRTCVPVRYTHSFHCLLITSFSCAIARSMRGASCILNCVLKKKKFEIQNPKPYHAERSWSFDYANFVGYNSQFVRSHGIFSFFLNYYFFGARKIFPNVKLSLKKMYADCI